MNLLFRLLDSPEQHFLSHADLSEWLAAERALAAKRRRRRRLRRGLLATLLGLLFVYTLLLPRAQTQALVTSLPFCGTAAQTFAHFGWPEAAIPSADALTALPAPGTPAAQSGVSYDPAAQQLCAQSRQALSAYLPGSEQASGAGATTTMAHADPLTNLVINAVTALAWFMY